jgi:NAD-dependent deacetylase
MKRLWELINNSDYCIAFTGAGVSTFSGIKDFRGKNGVYRQEKIDADKIFSLEYFKQDPSYYYLNTKNFIYDVETKEPGLVHSVLAELELKGLLKTVITQNIDMLHQKAGSKHVIEVHGTPAEHYCMNCGKTFSYREIAEQVQRDIVPVCFCGGSIKPRITFFGEMLDEDALTSAFEEASKADLTIVLGSTLIVQPAASIPAITLRNGGDIVIVNDMPTPLDSKARLIYHDLGEVFNFLAGELN